MSKNRGKNGGNGVSTTQWKWHGTTVLRTIKLCLQLWEIKKGLGECICVVSVVRSRKCFGEKFVPGPIFWKIVQTRNKIFGESGIDIEIFVPGEILRFS